ncbi:MAG TPA: c-type cytochrome [Blastocatellia bacterium]|nr:c-type cytochrome [Blastocatellia bacterium]
MTRRLIKIAVLLVALAFGGFLVAASGIIPIKASSGHWAITSWFLNFTKERSIATHSLGLEAPSLDEPSLVVKGAGHYETGCSPCHGSPKLRSPWVAQQMTPNPPYLPPEISEWEPEELFYIVKHGVKFTGMPAWPSQHRDDEVWAMVAFLRALPELDAEQYRRLVNDEAAATTAVGPIQGLQIPEKTQRAVIESCSRCHSTDGLGRSMGAFPRLAGQNQTYLHASLQAYARGERHSGIMELVAARLSPEEMSELARYYESLKSPSPSLREADSAVERGKEIALHGIPNQRVPACASCHGPGAIPRNPAYPLLAGQYADYLVLQLELFKNEHRGGTAYSHLMRPVAARLTAEQMRDVALYYASLDPASALPAR